MSFGLPLLDHGRGGPCSVCGGENCAPSPDLIHPESYPFLPGGRPVAEGTEGVDWVTTPHALVDSERNRIVYVAGSRVPMDDAVKFGLVAKKPKTEKRAKKGPAEDRAKKPDKNRGVNSENAGALRRRR